MNDTTSSPQPNKTANRNKTKRSGFGCALTFVLLLVGLGVAVLVLGPRLLDQLVNQMSVQPVALNDQTSPEQLAERREQEIAQLNGYGWVDQEAGIAHIPITRAIALIAETGLPVGSESTGSEPATPDTTSAPPVDLANVNYQDHVLPIFQQHCSECHGDEEQEEGLRLTSYRSAMNGSQNGPVIEPDDPDNSYLVEMVVSGKMPKRGPRLSQAEIDTIIAWIKAGAPEKGTATAAAESTASEAVTATVDLANVSFRANVLPIFEQHCSECHGDEEQEEGLRLTSYRSVINGSQNGPVIEPGDPDNSYLVEMVVSGKMPKRGDPLSPAEIDIITAWIKAGALDN